MFFDWLRMYQDFSEPLPVVGERITLETDAQTGEHLSTSQRPFKHEGSYSTSITVRIRGNRIIVDGNPSRYGRPENLFGFKTIDECVAVYNKILTSYGLPNFTECTKLDWFSGEDGKKASRCSDGAVIQELHITSNWAVGRGNVLDFIKAISTQPYRQMVPRLHTNGQTTDWLTKSCKGSDLIYPTCYNKAHDLETKALKKIEKKYGIESAEYTYLKSVVDYCKANGVVRFEQKLKRLFLQQNNLQFWGIDDFTPLKALHDEFVHLKDKMQVEAMDFENISQQLISSGVCDNTRSANTTAMYAINWMHGQKFDLSMGRVKLHRARLRKIGIDIAYSCDLSKFSVVVAKNARVITMDDLPVPTWYQPATVEGVRVA